LVNFINKATFLKNGKKVNINPQAGLRAKQPRLKRTPRQAWGDINPQAGLGAKRGRFYGKNGRVYGNVDYLRDVAAGR
jgi:hypothetical protein